MTDIAVTEAPADLEPPPPAPEAVELEAAAPDAAPQDAAAPAEEPPAPEAAQPAHPIVGSLRRAIIDHLTDTEGPQSVGQILAALPVGTSRNTAEGAIRRAHAAGEIERVGAGLYVLGKPKPAEQSKPAAPDPAPSAEPEPQPDPEQLRLAAENAKLISQTQATPNLITREIPRLCRGGSKSLTVPAVKPQAPTDETSNTGPQSTLTKFRDSVDGLS